MSTNSIKLFIVIMGFWLLLLLTIFIISAQISTSRVHAESEKQSVADPGTEGNAPPVGDKVSSTNLKEMVKKVTANDTAAPMNAVKDGGAVGAASTDINDSLNYRLDKGSDNVRDIASTDIVTDSSNAASTDADGVNKKSNENNTKDNNLHWKFKERESWDDTVSGGRRDKK